MTGPGWRLALDESGAVAFLDAPDLTGEALVAAVDEAVRRLAAPDVVLTVFSREDADLVLDAACGMSRFDCIARIAHADRGVTVTLRRRAAV